MAGAYPSWWSLGSTGLFVRDRKKGKTVSASVLPDAPFIPFSGFPDWNEKLRRERHRDIYYKEVALAGSGRGLKFSVVITVQVPQCPLQEETHFVFFFTRQGITVEMQHFMPVLNLGLENKSPGRFHYFAQLHARLSWSDGTAEIILISTPAEIRIHGACTQRMHFMTGRS